MYNVALAELIAQRAEKNGADYRTTLSNLKIDPAEHATRVADALGSYQHGGRRSVDGGRGVALRGPERLESRTV